MCVVVRICLSWAHVEASAEVGQSCHVGAGAHVPSQKTGQSDGNHCRQRSSWSPRRIMSSSAARPGSRGAEHPMHQTPIGERRPAGRSAYKHGQGGARFGSLVPCHRGSKTQRQRASKGPSCRVKHASSSSSVRGAMSSGAAAARRGGKPYEAPGGFAPPCCWARAWYHRAT